MSIQIADVAADGNLEGFRIGSPVSIIREYTAVPGAGPRLHRHPYAETFVIHGGRALFTVGEEQLVGTAGQILVVPQLIWHRFEVLEGGTYAATHVHANDRFITEWSD